MDRMQIDLASDASLQRMRIVPAWGVVCVCLIILTRPSCLWAYDPYATLTFTTCGDAYRVRIQEKQAALIHVYREAIEDSSSKEQMAAIEKCTEKLRDVFRWKGWSFSFPGLPDFEKLSKDLMEKAMERVCEETLGALNETVINWESVWQFARKNAQKETVDWSVLTINTARANQRLSERIRALVYEILR